MSDSADGRQLPSISQAPPGMKTTRGSASPTRQTKASQTCLLTHSENRLWTRDGTAPAPTHLAEAGQHHNPFTTYTLRAGHASHPGPG